MQIQSHTKDKPSGQLSYGNRLNNNPKATLTMKFIPLTQGQFAQVDDADYESLIRFKWNADKNGLTFYAKRWEKGKNIKMHRQILGLTDPKIEADHEDHNGLNNQRKNLRKCTHADNVKNRTGYGKSKYVGVKFTSSKKPQKKPWITQIRINGKQVHIGCFTTEIEAARAFDKRAKEVHGEFANLNFPDYLITESENL